MIFDLKNITVQELYQLDENSFKAYMNLQDMMKPKGVFAKRKAVPLGQLTYGQVSTIKRNLNNPTFDNLYQSFDFVFQVKKQTYLNQDVVDYLYSLNWLKNETIKLIERENKNLKMDPDPIMEMAGIERLVPFGELNVLIPLSEKYGKTIEEIENWKYNLVFTLLLHNKVSGEVMKRYNELKYGNKG